MKYSKLLIGMSLILAPAHSKANQEPTSNIVLLGSIQFEHPLDQEMALPVLYKGNECKAQVEKKGDKKKAHFELYEQEKPTELFILITEYLKRPEHINIKNFFTSCEHPYRLFKLTLQQQDKDDTHNEAFDYWLIEELKNTKKSIPIADTAIIFFMSPDLVDTLEPTTWQQESSIMRLPTIKLKKNISKEIIDNLEAYMNLTIPDFRFCHKKTSQAFIPYANNRILSMPFRQRTVA